MKNELYNLGKTQIEYEGIIINIYDKERLLIDWAKNKNQIGYDLYKEIISNYRNIAESSYFKAKKRNYPFLSNFL